MMMIKKQVKRVHHDNCMKMAGKKVVGRSQTLDIVLNNFNPNQKSIDIPKTIQTYQSKYKIIQIRNKLVYIY